MTSRGAERKRNEESSSKMTILECAPVEDGGDSRLASVARDFVRLIQVSADLQIDLSHAAKSLNVPKEQLVDVANILEGVGYTERISSDKVKLTNIVAIRNQCEEGSRLLHARLENILDEEATLDSWISQIKDLDSRHAVSKDKKGLLQSSRATTDSSSSSSSYLFGGCSPYTLQCTPSNRLIQVSSEDTDETIPSTGSELSLSISPASYNESLNRINTRKRPLPLPKSFEQNAHPTKTRLGTEEGKVHMLSPDTKFRSGFPEENR